MPIFRWRHGVIYSISSQTQQQRSWQRLRFEEAFAMTVELKLSDCINETCPWSGKPVSADALTIYRGAVVGFCNTGCRDKFEKAATAFEQALVKAADRPA